MAKKFEIKSNYLVVSDTETSKVDFQAPKKDIYFRDEGNAYRFYKTDTDINIGGSFGYPFGLTQAVGSITLNSGESTKATGTVTLATALANEFSTNTAECVSVVAGDTLTVNGLLYTAVDGAKADNTQFSVDTGDDECATDLADSINNDVRTGTLGVVYASVATDTVTLTSNILGVSGDATTLEQTGGTITIGGATFSSGVDADTVTVNGLVYTAVSGTKADNTEFSIDTSNTLAATDLADSITNDTRTGVLNDVTATSSVAVVTATTSIGGTVGNATTLVSSSGTRLAVTGSGFFTGGLDNALVSGATVNSVGIMSGTEIFVTDLATTAINVADNITAFTSTPNYIGEAVGNKINIISVTPGTAVNGFVVASSTTVINATDVDMSGSTADIVDSSGDPFADETALLAFLRGNTGA